MWNKTIVILIYVVSLGLLYLTSMQGFYLVGSDIHSEYYIASRMYNGWDINYPHLYNASISTTLIAPFISKFLSIDLIVVFKMIYPALFALVPVILYFVYRKAIGSVKAVFAVLFFIAVPVFFLEMPQLPRQQLAEVFLCIVILLMVIDIEYKTMLIAPCVALIVMLHYTVGLLAIALLLGMFLVKAVNSKLRLKFIGDSKISYRGIIITLTIGITLAAVWGMNVADNMPIRAINNIFNVGHVSTASTISAASDSVTAPDVTVAAKADNLIMTAVGLDIFNGTSVWGKIFRVVQWITQLLVILGCFRLLFRYKKYRFSSEFTSGIAASCILLLMCLTVFGFSRLLGMTRFYHVSLIFLAPIFVLGGDLVCSIKIRRNISIWQQKKNEALK